MLKLPYIHPTYMGLVDSKNESTHTHKDTDKLTLTAWLPRYDSTHTHTYKGTDNENKTPTA